MKNSFVLGLGLGLAFSSVLAVLLDLVVFLSHSPGKKRLMEADVTFVAGIIAALLFARYYLKRPEQSELGKGFMFSAFIWAAAYVFLFHVTKVNTLIF